MASSCNTSGKLTRPGIQSSSESRDTAGRACSATPSAIGCLNLGHDFNGERPPCAITGLFSECWRCSPQAFVAAPAQATGRGKGVNFPVSCSAGAQQAFNEALAALHSFWYAQAAKEFRAIAEREPDCAMAHWGYAMSQWTQLWAPPRQDALDAGLASLRRAGALTNKSQRESDFVAAAMAFFGDNDKLDHRTRLAAYASAIDRVGQQLSGRQRGFAVLCAVPARDCRSSGRDLRQAAASRGGAGAHLQGDAGSSGGRSLYHPCLRLRAVGGEGAGGGRALRQVCFRRAACHPHAVTHLRAARALAGQHRVQPRRREGGARARHSGRPAA